MHLEKQEAFSLRRSVVLYGIGSDIRELLIKVIFIVSQRGLHKLFGFGDQVQDLSEVHILLQFRVKELNCLVLQIIVRCDESKIGRHEGVSLIINKFDTATLYQSIDDFVHQIY